jgi:hypothetical protein
MNDKTRQTIERRIIETIAKDMIAAGNSVSVHDGEEVTVSKSIDVNAVVNATMTVDEEHLIVHDNTGTRIGSIFLVYGNDGWDVVNDYSVSLKALLMNATKVAAKLEADYA